jgi:hypothetical protein
MPIPSADGLLLAHATLALHAAAFKFPPDVQMHTLMRPIILRTSMTAAFQLIPQRQLTREKPAQPQQHARTRKKLPIVAPDRVMGISESGDTIVADGDQD